MECKGIDLSYGNGFVDWEKIKKAGVKFAIIRTGYGIKNAKQIDKQFENNYKGAKQVGIPLGAYHYSYAVTPQEAKKEAEFMLEIIKGKKFEYPIFFDIEEERHVKLTKKECTEIVQAFCGILEQAGYWAGVYSFDSFFETNLEQSVQNRYATWVARVPETGTAILKPKYCKRYDIFQYSWKGAVLGSSKETDMNISYKDFPNLIKKAKKNGYTGTEKLYKITGSIGNLTEEQANYITDQLKNLGMTVQKI